MASYPIVQFKKTSAPCQVPRPRLSVPLALEEASLARGSALPVLAWALMIAEEMACRHMEVRWATLQLRHVGLAAGRDRVFLFAYKPNYSMFEGLTFRHSPSYLQLSGTRHV